MRNSNQEVEVVIIPKGTRMKIHGCLFELAQDIEVFATQEAPDNSSKSHDKNFEEIENAIVYLFRHSPRVEIALRNALIRARPPRVIF